MTGERGLQGNLRRVLTGGLASLPDHVQTHGACGNPKLSYAEWCRQLWPSKRDPPFHDVGVLAPLEGSRRVSADEEAPPPPPKGEEDEQASMVVDKSGRLLKSALLPLFFLNFVAVVQ